MSNGALQRLFDLLAILRGEDGCPWDRAQTPDRILSDLIEETYELQWAYAQGSEDEILDETGDVVFVLVFALVLLQEKYPRFTLKRITQHAHDKIRRRHPHVFENAVARTKEEGLAHWNRMKAEERGLRPASGSPFRDVPGNLTAIRRAEKVQTRASRHGFDWTNARDVLAKIREELDEVERHLADDATGLLEDELGDLYFAVVNLSRFLHLDGEKVLTGATAKFIARYERMTALAEEDGHAFANLTLDEMERYWQRAKRDE